MNIIMARAYCHKIIKLSGVIQSLAPEKEVVCNVHGVRQKFLDVGQEYAHKVGVCVCVCSQLASTARSVCALFFS